MKQIKIKIDPTLEVELLKNKLNKSFCLI